MNLLAVLGSEVRIENPEMGDYLFHGGHRLWVAPEMPGVTHVPDDNICHVRSTGRSLDVTAAPDRAGFAKTIEIRADNDRLIVEHHLTWHGEVPLAASPWAITQLPPGGTAILPLPRVRRTDNAFQADRTIVLWPYTRLDDSRITWKDQAVLMEASPGRQSKLGSGPEARKLGYVRDGFLFSKWFHASPGANYADLGATCQVFLHDHFCELETLGPMRTLEPEASISHVEVWKVSECATIDEALEILLEEDEIG